MNFLPHFEELRKRLLFSFTVFFVFAVIAYFFSHTLLDFFTWPLRRYTQEPLFFQKPYEAFVMHLKTSAFTALILSSPVILTQLWFFVAPGLYEKEKKIFSCIIFISISLFLIGAAFAFFWVIPWGLQLMLSFQTEGIKPMLAVASYFSFVSGMILAFGILFDFPVILVGLVELGIVKTEWLSKSRKSIIVILFIAAAILTPSPDPLSQLFLALPLWALFEISLLIAARLEKAKTSETGLI